MTKTNRVTLIFLTVLSSLVFSSVRARASTETVELYSWQDVDGTIAYSLMTRGVREGKKLPDLASHKVKSLSKIEKKLLGLEQGTRVNWNDLTVSKLDSNTKERFVLPDATAYNRIRSAAARAKLKVTIAQSAAH